MHRPLYSDYSPTHSAYGPSARAQQKARSLSPQERTTIADQIDFYFGDANFFKDKYLQKATKKGKDRWVPLATIADFKKMQSLTNSVAVMAAALGASQVVEVSADGTCIRRCDELVEVQVHESWLRTVVAEDLPAPTDPPSLLKRFSSVG